LIVLITEKSNICLNLCINLCVNLTI
jgi:hypothetical protein